MKKPLNYLLLGLVGLVVLAVAGAVVLALTFDPNRYKAEIERIAKEKTGRTLRLQGDLELAFFPSIGAKVAGVSLTERGSDQQFLALESAHVAVKLMPLLRGEMVVDALRVTGLKAQVVKGKDGRFNFDDLLGAVEEKKPAAKPQRGGEPIRFDITGVKVERSAIDYRDLATGTEIALSDVKLSTGRIAGKTEGNLALDLSVTSPNLPMKTLKLPVSGSFKADLEKQTASADLTARLDESTLQAKLSLARFSPPAYQFDVGIDRLNVDKYFPPAPEAKSQPGAAKPSAQKADTPVDLSFLKELNANGKLQLGALQVRGLKLANVKAELRAANGRLDVAPHSASLYEGTVNGALVLHADNRIALKEALSKVSVGPLLRDVAQSDRLEGRGNIALEVATGGKSVDAMKKALSGTAKVELRDGAIKGINLAEVVRKAKSALGAESGQTAATGQKTDFSELAASFTIKNGVAHNEDLDLKAPLVRVTGRGDVDIGNSRIDYVMKAAVVGTTKGQGGAERAELSGVTVPVRLAGSFEDIRYQVDYRGAAAELAKSKAGEKLKERVGEKLKGLLGR